MLGRFDNMPSRLRRTAQAIARRHAVITDGQRMAFADLIEDAALKIEALEADLKHHTNEPEA